LELVYNLNLLKFIEISVVLYTFAIVSKIVGQQ